MLISKKNFKKPQKLLDKSLQTLEIASAYDVIVVGAGPAGSTAAYFMAKEGLKVLLLDRAPSPGTKNCGGWSVISEATHKLFPNFWEECPCERVITDQAYWWLTEDSLLAGQFQSMKLAAAPYNRFSIKRPTFYAWLSDKASREGADFKINHLVSEIVFNKEYAVGVRVSSPYEAIFKADIIILADGANSLLAQKAKLISPLKPEDIALFVKETISFPSNILEQKFGLPKGHGSIIGLIGYPTAGFNGTASIHLFKESLNINVGMPISSFSQSGIHPYTLLERIKKHPYIQPILDGGVSLETGANLIPEGGYYAIPPLVHPGLMIIGDAGSLVNGTHGINLSLWSGYYAAQSAYEAKRYHDFSINKLSLYLKLLDESFIMQDMKANAGAAKLLRDIPYMFDLYTRMANEAAYYTTKVYAMPKRAKRKLIFKKVVSMQSLTKIIRDAWKALKVVR